MEIIKYLAKFWQKQIWAVDGKQQIYLKWPNYILEFIT